MYEFHILLYEIGDLYNNTLCKVMVNKTYYKISNIQLSLLPLKLYD